MIGDPWLAVGILVALLIPLGLMAWGFVGWLETMLERCGR